MAQEFGTTEYNGPSSLSLDDLEFGADAEDSFLSLDGGEAPEQGDDTLDSENKNPTVEDSERKAFMANVEIAFDGTSIESDRIQNIIISHEYDSLSLPTIVIALSLDSEMYTKVVQGAKVAKIYLKIDYEDAHSETSLPKKYIEGQYSYFLSTTSPNYTSTLDESNTNADSSFKTIHVGLMAMEGIDELRCSFNGVKKNIDMNTLIYTAIEGTNIVLQDLLYNEQFDTIIIPPIPSRSKFINYLFDKSPFYDTDYMYFIDFDASYLLSRDGTPVPANDNTLDSIVIDVREVTTEESYYDGMEIKNGAYYIYVNPANTNVSLNQAIEKVANTLVVMNEDGSQTVPLGINRGEGATKEKITYRRTDNPLLMKNAIESSTLTIEIAKDNIDSRYITPNKQYSVRNYADYDEYNGQYLLMYKHEVINGKAGEFTVSTAFGLRKLGNIESIGNSSLSSGYRKSSTSSTSQYSTSSGGTTRKGGVGTTNING